MPIGRKEKHKRKEERIQESSSHKKSTLCPGTNDIMPLKPHMSQKSFLNGHEFALSQGLNADNKWQENANVRDADFAPAFISSEKTILSDNGIEPAHCGENGLLAAHVSQKSQPSFLTPAKMKSTSLVSHCTTTGKKKRKAVGPLVKQLISIRGSIGGDYLRLNSSFQGSSKHRMDVSDPRNRAETFMDVTIMNLPHPWMNDKLVTVLGYVHTFVRHNSGKALHLNFGHSLESNSDTQFLPTHTLREENEDEKEPHFSWICFTCNTHQEHTILPKTQLRIYNPVIVPNNFANGTSCRFLSLVLCTQLYELYPKGMTDLPDVPSIVM